MKKPTSKKGIVNGIKISVALSVDVPKPNFATAKAANPISIASDKQMICRMVLPAIIFSLYAVISFGISVISPLAIVSLPF